MDRNAKKKQSNPRLYLAYGSNLNIAQMRWRCPGALVLGTAELNGWELLFRGSKTGSYLTVENAEGGMAPVAVWQVTPEDEAALDRYEGYPRFYYKKEMRIRFTEIMTGETRDADAFIYIMHEDRPYGIPSELYMEICQEGYGTFGFDTRILEEARERSIRLVENKKHGTEKSGSGEHRKSGHSGFLKNFTLVAGGHHGREN